MNTKQFIATLPLTVIAFGSHFSFAAPGIISDEPLFLGTATQPNILFVVDDSGSMSWEILKSTGATAVYPGLRNSGNLDITPNPNPDNGQELLESCSGYNVMYYNPDQTYTPWVGQDSAGAYYADQTITAARWNPYSSATGAVNLTNVDNGLEFQFNFTTFTIEFVSVGVGVPGYIPWDDADGDGEFDEGECGDDADGAANPFFGNSLPAVDYSRFVPITSMSAEQQTNFANWYSYYRKRDYVAKRALSEIVTDSSARMGLATLHNNNSVGTIIRDVDDRSLPIDATAQTNKANLLNSVFSINPGGLTPLRQTLEEAGDYFEVGTAVGTGLFGFTPAHDSAHESTNSPILSADNGGACQQNFTVLMTDGNWNGSTAPTVGNTDTDGLGDFDGGSHADLVSNTLADVAMHYYETDLAPTLNNSVPTLAGVDENNTQHMVTYGVAFGVNGTLTDNPPNRTDAFTWPTPVSGQETTIDDLRHAAWNGRGEFLNAGNPDELITSLSNTIASIDARVGTAAAASFNTTSIETDTNIFLASFNSLDWSGDLRAIELNDDGTTGNQVWSAAEVLNDRDLASDERSIITFNGSVGVPFRFPIDHQGPQSDEIGLDQLEDLLADAPNPIATTDTDEVRENQDYGERLVNFLRGDLALDGAEFRNRDGDRLGDIINSSPQFVGVPNRRYPNALEGSGNLYTDFIVEHVNRRPMVYIGGNDGMLHGFDADDGEEVFAYIPGLVYSSEIGEGLHYLADMEYNHNAYVDDSPNISDVFIDGDWRTYLIGGMRSGGKGVYVLDVTNPNNLVESQANDIVKFEFTHEDLGLSFSQPQFARLNNGKWAMIFGNGYNSDPDGTGESILFVVYLDGSGFERFTTGAGSMVNNDCSDPDSDCNGMSTPRVLDLTSDGKVDRVYAGDLQGNLWVFDLSSDDTNDWGLVSSEPLFTACNSTVCNNGGRPVNRQPITSQPLVRVHPEQRRAFTEPNLLVYFGTGQYLTINDQTSTDVQTMYGIWDAGSNNYGLSRDDLQEQVLSTTLGSTERDLTDNEVSYGAVSNALAEQGWYIDLIDSGERVILEAISVGRALLFVSNVPDASECGAGGYSYINIVDRISGGRLPTQAFDYNNDGNIDGDDALSSDRVDNLVVGTGYLGGSNGNGSLALTDALGNVDLGEFGLSNDTPSRRASWTIID